MAGRFGRAIDPPGGDSAVSFAAYNLDPAGQLHVGLDPARITSALESNGGLLWVDLEGLGPRDRELLLDQIPWVYYAVLALTASGLGLVLWMLWLRRWMVGGSRALRRQRLRTFVPTAVDPVRLTSLAGRTMARNLRRRIR